MSLIDPQPPLEGADLPPDPGIDDPESEQGKTEDKWLRIARQAYESSSDWVDANLRFQWDKSLSLFNSNHPPGSKYNTEAYAKRSKFFRPKTRTAVRNLQSAMAVAFFTNDDVVSVNARNSNDPLQAAAALVDQAISEIETEEGITADEVQEIAEAAGLTEDQVLELIGTQLEGYSPDLDLSQYATQEQLGDFATQEQLQGLESMFQNYLTPEQLQSYLPQEGQYITPEQLAEATDNDYDEVIKGLTDQLGDLETKYQDVQSQYEADAVQSQIDQTKDDLNNFFRGAVPSGPRTGSTSQFSSGASFLPGGSPMANLIGGQRQGLGQDPFSTYLKTFTPSYTPYDAPVTPEEYGQASTPLISTQYSNPFTGGSSYSGGYNQGGQVSNGIMDLTNFDTNVQPFQNAFRPNVPRN